MWQVERPRNCTILLKGAIGKLIVAEKHHDQVSASAFHGGASQCAASLYGCCMNPILVETIDTWMQASAAMYL